MTLMSSGGNFLPALTASLTKTASNDPAQTLDFVDTMNKVVPIFEHLGAHYNSSNVQPMH